MQIRPLFTPSRVNRGARIPTRPANLRFGLLIGSADRFGSEGEPEQQLPKTVKETVRALYKTTSALQATPAFIGGFVDGGLHYERPKRPFQGLADALLGLVNPQGKIQERLKDALVTSVRLGLTQDIDQFIVSTKALLPLLRQVAEEKNQLPAYQQFVRTLDTEAAKIRLQADLQTRTNLQHWQQAEIKAKEAEIKAMVGQSVQNLSASFSEYCQAVDPRFLVAKFSTEWIQHWTKLLMHLNTFPECRDHYPDHETSTAVRGMLSDISDAGSSGQLHFDEPLMKTLIQAFELSRKLGPFERSYRFDCANGLISHFTDPALKKRAFQTLIPDPSSELDNNFRFNFSEIPDRDVRRWIAEGLITHSLRDLREAGIPACLYAFKDDPAVGYELLKQATQENIADGPGYSFERTDGKIATIDRSYYRPHVMQAWYRTVERLPSPAQKIELLGLGYPHSLSGYYELENLFQEIPSTPETDALLVQHVLEPALRMPLPAADKKDKRAVREVASMKESLRIIIDRLSDRNLKAQWRKNFPFKKIKRPF